MLSEPCREVRERSHSPRCVVISMCRRPATAIARGVQRPTLPWRRSVRATQVGASTETWGERYGTDQGAWSSAWSFPGDSSPAAEASFPFPKRDHVDVHRVGVSLEILGSLDVSEVLSPPSWRAELAHGCHSLPLHLNQHRP